MTDSLAQVLACIDCGATFPLTYRLECARCRGLLEIRYDLEAMRRRGPALLSGRGLWRYAAVLPVPDPARPGLVDVILAYEAKDAVGEMALLEGGRRTATLRAVTPCRIAVVAGEQLDRDARSLDDGFSLHHRWVDLDSLIRVHRVTLLPNRTNMILPPFRCLGRFGRSVTQAAGVILYPASLGLRSAAL